MIRISSLPSLLACPSSALPVEHPYDPPSDMAALGTAAHAALALHVARDVVDINAIARKHGVDAEDLEQLYSYGLTAWRELRLQREHATPEMPLQGRGIRGTADVVYQDGTACAVIDWKTNRVKRDYGAQLTGYAAALMDNLVAPKPRQIKTCVVWLRFGEFEVAAVTEAEIDRLHQSIERAKADMGKRYAPGDACGYCPRQLVCKARHEYLTSATVALSPLADIGLTPEAARQLLPSLYHKAKHLRRALAAYDQALKLVLADGPLDDGQGGELELEIVTREKIKAREAWGALVEAGLGDAELSQCVSISKSALMRAIGDAAPKGRKGQVRAQLMESLREAGAIEQTTFETVKRKGNT